MNKLLERVMIDPDVGGGKPSIRRTRICVSPMLDYQTQDVDHVVGEPLT
jgi:uncharacterized protein (DUF433 family)